MFVGGGVPDAPDGHGINDVFSMCHVARFQQGQVTPPYHNLQVDNQMIYVSPRRDEGIAPYRTLCCSSRILQCNQPNIS